MLMGDFPPGISPEQLPGHYGSTLSTLYISVLRNNVTLTDGVPGPHIVAAADQRTHVSERPHGVLELDQI